MTDTTQREADERAGFRVKAYRAADLLPTEMVYKTTDVHAARTSLTPTAPIDMVLHCPKCSLQHVDEPDERTPDWQNPPHRSHLCHGCGHIWRPADVQTNGVKAIQTKGANDTPTAPQAASPAFDK